MIDDPRRILEPAVSSRCAAIIPPNEAATSHTFERAFASRYPRFPHCSAAPEPGAFPGSAARSVLPSRALCAARMVEGTSLYVEPYTSALCYQ